MRFLFCTYSLCFLFPSLPLHWANKEGKKQIYFLIIITRDSLWGFFSYNISFSMLYFLLFNAPLKALQLHFSHISKKNKKKNKKKIFINLKNVLLLLMELYKKKKSTKFLQKVAAEWCVHHWTITPMIPHKFFQEKKKVTKTNFV